MTKIKPFTDLWLNCIDNAVFSLLQSMNSTYRIAPLINSYKYVVNNECINYSCGVSYPIKDIELQTKSGNEKYHQLLQEHVTIVAEKICDSANDAVDFLIKNLSNNDHYAVLQVTLRHWVNPLLHELHEMHTHNSLVVDYNEEEELFYVLDDDDNGYRIHKIPVEKILKAIHLNEDEPLCIMKQPETGLPDFEIDFNELKLNTDFLISQLASINCEGVIYMPFKGSGDYDFQLYIEHFTFVVGNLSSIRDRHLANHMLFKYIQDTYPELSKQLDLILETSTSLYKDWGKFRNMILRDSMKRKISFDSETCHNFLTNIFNLELEMWENFKSIIKDL